MSAEMTPDELNALIVDRHGNRVYSRTVGEKEIFFMLREGKELQPAPYASNPAYLEGEAAVNLVPEDRTGKELFTRSRRQELTPYELACEWVAAFVGSPDERLRIIRSRAPE